MLDAPPIRITQDIPYQREISIANALELLVEEGSFVYPNTPLMRVPVLQPSITIPLAKILNVKPKDMARFLLKRTGDSVQSGEIVARRKARLFSPVREYIAPLSGEVEFVDYDKGEMVLTQPASSVVVPSKAFGKITSIYRKEKAIVEVQATLIDCIWGRGTGAVGRIKVFTQSNSEIERDKLAGNLAECLIIGGVWSRDDILYFAQRLGARGIIAGGAPAVGRESFLDPAARVPLSIAITDGFGAAAMNTRAYTCFKAYEGCEAWLNPLPNGRAEVVINQEDSFLPKENQKPVLASGSIVRLTRDPYFAQTAMVVSIPSSKDLTAGETLTDVIVVRLADGSLARVPRSNVELLVI